MGRIGREIGMTGTMRWRREATALGLCALLGACGSDEGNTGDDALTVPTTYAFESRLTPGTSSVDYGGQIGRHLLIAKISEEMEDLTAEIDGGAAFAAGDVQAKLTFFYDFDGTTGGEVAHGLSFSPEPLQKTFGAASGKKVSEKIAGNDPVGQHVDWNQGGLIGWDGATTPDALVRNWFAELDQAAADRSAGKIGKGADGKPLAEVHITAGGHHLEELVSKFLLGAVAYSQASDDYLDDDTDGKGLRSDHSKAESDGKAYTALEHAWDEGFGYFGAARDYGAYTDAELNGSGGDAARKTGAFDTDGDGKIDLFSEWNRGHALYCGKRDAGAAGKAELDFTGAVWTALLRGRARIAATPLGGNDAAMLAELAKDRDAALTAWENCLAASLVHYINETLADMAKLGTAGWSHAAAAQHWSEMKGFALGLQFNRMARLDKAALKTLHTQIGMAPVLEGADAAAVTAGRQGLLDARKTIMDTYAFPAALAGDDNGEGGW